MSKVSVTKEKLDTLAEAVGAKSGESIPLTIDEMTDAVLSIPEINNQSKTVTPTESQQIISPDNDYTGLDSVTVRAISSNYVGSNIVQRDSNDLYANGNTVFVPNGYYNTSVSKSIAYAGEPTNTISLNSNTGVITSHVVQSYSGYVSAFGKHTYYELPTQGNIALQPQPTEQTATVSGKFMTGNVIVTPAKLISATVTPTATTQIIAPNTVLVNDFRWNGGTTGSHPSAQYAYYLNGNSITLPTGNKKYKLSLNADIGTNNITINGAIVGYGKIDQSLIVGNASLLEDISLYTDYLYVRRSGSGTTFNMNSLIIEEYVSSDCSISASSSNIDIDLVSPITVDCSGLTAGKKYYIEGTIKYKTGGSYTGTTTPAIYTDYIILRNNVPITFKCKYTESNSYYTTTHTLTFTLDWNNNSLSFVDAYSTSQGSSGQDENAPIQITINFYDIDSLNYGLSTVTVNPVPIDTSSTLTSNGVHTASSGSFWSSVTVSVPSDINNQAKTVTPTESVQTVSADSGYSGLGTVTVNAISSSYVGTGITRNPTPTASGGTVTIPSGYYETSVAKSVDTATAGTISVAVNASGLVTATATSPAGYFAGGTKTATTQLSTQSGTTITPTTTAQTAITSGKYTTGTITVAAVPTEEKTAVSNGDVLPSSGKFLSKVTVNVPSDIHNQNKTVTPTESVIEVTADSGYSGLGTVSVAAIPSDYVGTDIVHRDDNDLEITGATINVPRGYYEDGASASVSTVSQAVPAITVSTTGLITATATQTAGYVSGGTKTATQQLSVQSATTIIPTESEQTAVAAGKYTTGVVKVGAISSTYVGSGIAQNPTITVSNETITVPAGYYTTTSSKSVATGTILQNGWTTTENGTSYTMTAKLNFTAGYISTAPVIQRIFTIQQETITPAASAQTVSAINNHWLKTVTVAAVPTDTDNTFSANGTYTPESGKWFSSVTIDVPSGINNQAKTATPTTATQTIKPDSSYSGLSQVTINPIPSNYITTSDANATASQILINKTAYVNGAKVTGSMPDNGATGGTITAQGGTYSIPAGYTSGGTVTASLPVSTITNGVLNVATITEATNDYGVEASITIPAGYYNTTTLSRILSNVLPMTTSAITESQMLSGYEAYDYQGKLLTGTMTNRGAWNATLNDTITSTTIPAGYHNGSGTVSHTTVNIPDPTFSMNNSTGVITASGAWAKGFTTDNSYSNTYSLTTQAGKTVTPSETAQTAVSANRWVTGTVTVAAIPSDYVGSGITTRTSLNMSANTVTAPAGYYPNAVTATVTAMTLPTSAVTTSSGTAKATITRSTATRYINIPVGYNSTAAHYVISAVANGTVVPPTTITGSQATVTAGTNVLTFSKSISVTPNVTTAGYISAGTASNVTVTLSAAVTTKAAATYTPGTTTQTIAANQYLTGAQTIAGDADLVAANIKTGVQIFGVNGTFTADATATASDIMDGETAYVNGSKITGSLVVQTYYTGRTAPAASLGNNGDIYLQS